MVSITKLQNLKAIHNFVFVAILLEYVVINRKTIKFESNSQRPVRHTLWLLRCYQSQNYKIWKQFTTTAQDFSASSALLSITKLQNLKAIHNTSQEKLAAQTDVINHKTTKLESNSQHNKLVKNMTERCYQSQNYKIWKQFTTATSGLPRARAMLSIAKLQNLKAIHNRQISPTAQRHVVINHKTTKIESNSQLFCIKEF